MVRNLEVMQLINKNISMCFHVISVQVVKQEYVRMLFRLRYSAWNVYLHRYEIYIFLGNAHLIEYLFYSLQKSN